MCLVIVKSQYVNRSFWLVIYLKIKINLHNRCWHGGLWYNRSWITANYGNHFIADYFKTWMESHNDVVFENPGRALKIGKTILNFKFYMVINSTKISRLININEIGTYLNSSTTLEWQFYGTLGLTIPMHFASWISVIISINNSIKWLIESHSNVHVTCWAIQNCLGFLQHNLKM